jgi:hypothetical protein
MVISLTTGAAINGGVVPSFTTKHLTLSFKLQGWHHSATTRLAKFMINEGINNHPLKKFTN